MIDTLVEKIPFHASQNGTKNGIARILHYTSYYLLSERKQQQNCVNSANDIRLLHMLSKMENEPAEVKSRNL
jgi:hypothetical protein